MAISCPTCGHEMVAAHAPLESLSGAPLSKRERQIVDVLARAYPRDLDIQQLVCAMYSDDPAGGPDDPEGVIRVLVSRLRVLLPEYGWNIPINRTGHGNFGRYRLKPVEVKR